MINAKISVIRLAAVTGIFEVNSAYIEREIPEVSLVLIVLIAWGRKETVVQKAAARPNRVTGFIFVFREVSALLLFSSRLPKINHNKTLCRNQSPFTI